MELKKYVDLLGVLPVGKHKPADPEKTLSQGVLFTGGAENYPEDDLTELAKSLYLDERQVNSSFHKSWDKVLNAPYAQLIMEQLVHYFTTYGFENLGIESGYVYVPDEQLDLPEKTGNFPVRVVKGASREYILEEAVKLAGGIALEESTAKQIAEIMIEQDIPAKMIDDISNKEVGCRMYDLTGKLPEDPRDFIQYLVYTLTGNTLLIKSPEVLGALKEADSQTAGSLLKRYERENGLEPLAGIFNRHKPILLALKGSGSSHTINRISKLSKKYHKPYKGPVLNRVTDMIRNNSLDMDKLERKLKDTDNPFRLIRLLQALQYEIYGGSEKVYRIRNGKSYASYSPGLNAHQKKIGEEVKGKILSCLRNLMSSVDGNVIYIPEGVSYGLPVSEKQFTGQFPNGSSFRYKDPLIAGVWWRNQGKRIDLDLSVRDISGRKTGWDASYRREGVTFSGDMTDASEGASEMFRIEPGSGYYILMVNFFNYFPGDIPFRIYAGESNDKVEKNYMMKTSDIVMEAESVINRKQEILGIITEDRFYINQSSMGNSITALGNQNTQKALNYMLQSCACQFSLEDILGCSGATVVSSRHKPDGEEIEVDVDLSPGKLSRDTILKLFR